MESMNWFDPIIIIVDASLFHDMKIQKFDKVIFSVDEFDAVSNSIKELVIGNLCLNEMKEISFSRFTELKTLNIGCISIANVKSVIIESRWMIIDWLDIPHLTTIITMYCSFFNSESLTLSSNQICGINDLIFLNLLHSLLEMVVMVSLSAKQQVWVYQVFITNHYLSWSSKTLFILYWMEIIFRNQINLSFKFSIHAFIYQ